MIKVVFAFGLMLTAGSGLAAYNYMKQSDMTAGASQTAMEFLVDAPAGIMTFLFSVTPEVAERPRIAQLPQTSGVRTRGNTSMAERNMRATARGMVNASPTARAHRDAQRDASHARHWTKFSRKAPEADVRGGRLSALQARSRGERNQSDLAAAVAAAGN